MVAASWFDGLFAAAHARHPDAAMPGFVGSPMDDEQTVSVARATIVECDTAAGDRFGPLLTHPAAGFAAPMDAEMSRAAAGLPRPRRDIAN